MELNAVCENLGISKYSHLRIEHRMLFHHAHDLKVQRNRIIHQYGLPKSRLDWNIVWKTVNCDIEDALLPELTRVIDKESATGLFKLDEERRTTKTDQSNFQSSDNETENELGKEAQVMSDVEKSKDE